MRLLLLLVLLFALPVVAQVPTPAQESQLEQYLADRDIDRKELERRLAARGIRTEGLSPEEALRLRPQIEAVIAEMEAERERTAPAPAPDPTPAPAPAPPEPIKETTEPVTAKQPASDIYGHDLFRNKSLGVYRATDDTVLPNSYPLKPGDEIAVSIFGASQTDFILRLDEQGFVEFPNTFRMPLQGVPLGQARRLLSDRLKQFYTFRNGQLSVRIQAAQSVTVNVFGEVEQNGSFALSSLNTGFNALVAAGGPTERGSVRNIQLVQGDETTELDVYAYLQNPTEASANFLGDNATIYVPLATTIVTVEGGVQRPMRYELKAGETLADLVAFAGGLRTRAETGAVRVTRYVNSALEVLTVDLATAGSFSLRDEDIVTVPVITNPVENFVAVEGAVLLPGRYPYKDGLSLADLVAQGRLRPGARTDVAFLFRNNDDGTQRLLRIDLGADAGADAVTLKRGDRLRVLANSAFVDNATFSVKGAVRDSAVTLPFPQDGALTLEEALLLAGGLEPNAAPEVMLIRTPPSNREERRYEKIDLRTDADYALQAQDQVLVYPRERFTDPSTISIGGAVRQAGTFPYSPNLSFDDLLYLAGGPRIDAAPDRVEVFRLEIINGAETRTLVQTVSLREQANFTLQPYDEVVVRSAAEFELIRNVTLVGEVRYPGNYALLSDNERLSDLVTRAGGLTGEAAPAAARLFRPDGEVGYVVLDLDRVVDAPGDPANIVLLAGDTVFVPKRQEVVTIEMMGTLADRFGRDSTTAAGRLVVAYQGDQRADWYIDNYAGGFADSARPRWTTVEYANGQIRETKHFLLTERFPRVLPGATIRVGIKPEKIRQKRREERFDWIGLASVVVGAVSSIVTILVISRNRN